MHEPVIKNAQRIEFEINAVENSIIGIDRFIDNQLIERLIGGNEAATTTFIHFSELYPDACICWFDSEIKEHTSNRNLWPGLLNHCLEVRYFPGLQSEMKRLSSLGIVDRTSPFLIPTDECETYPSWLVSAIAGVCHASIIRASRGLVESKSIVKTLLLIGRAGTSSGLCCYSDARLFSQKSAPCDLAVRDQMSTGELAGLVKQLYGTRSLLFWLVGIIIKLHRLPVVGLVKAVSKRSPQMYVDLSRQHQNLNHSISSTADSVEVIIPTLGRPDYLLGAIQCMANQDHPPVRISVVIQDSENEGLHYPDLSDQQCWPFELSIHMVPWIGVCRARNLVIDQLTADWVVFLDDDIRAPRDYLSYLIGVGRSYGVEAVNAFPVEKNLIHKQLDSKPPYPWISFASGVALCSRSLVESTTGFDENMEGIPVEDYEYGVRIRRHGSHVLLTSESKVIHLAARSGGFRSESFPYYSTPKNVPRSLLPLIYSLSKYQSDMIIFGLKLKYSVGELLRQPIWRWPVTIFRLVLQWRAVNKWIAEERN